MKKIITINTTALRNDEFLGLFSEGLGLAKSITDKEAQQAITAYESSVKNLADFLENDLDETFGRMASQLDSERNSVFVSCRRVAQGYQNFPDKERAEVCSKIWKAFSESPSPLRLNQAQSTGAILNVIQSVRSLGDEDLEAVGFKIWIDKLDEVNAKFMESDLARFTERGQHELEKGKKLRIACFEAFSVVAAAATLKAAAGSESCVKFIDCMNAAIEAKKAQVKIRMSRTKTAELAKTSVDQPATHNSVTAGAANAA